jgi:hypothetical protein
MAFIFKGNSNLLADALSLLLFDERQNTYALPSHSHKDTGYSYQPVTNQPLDEIAPYQAHVSRSQDHAVTQPKRAIASLSQRVINDDSFHIQPNTHSEDTRYQYCPIFEETHDIDQQLYRSLDHFQSLALENDLIDCFLHLPVSENIPFILKPNLSLGCVQTAFHEREIEKIKSKQSAVFKQLSPKKLKN